MFCPRSRIRTRFLTIPLGLAISTVFGAGPVDQETTPRPAWLVVWGDDVGRFNTNGGYGSHRQRYASVPNDPAPPPFEGAPLEYFETGAQGDGDPARLDLDGDGNTEDDYVAAIRFSMDQPLSPPPWPHSADYPNPFCGRFYGGYTWYVANATPGGHPVYTEIGINPDHHWPYSDGRADDMPLKGMCDAMKPKSWHMHFLLTLWKKEDFLNDGNVCRVSLDADSRMAVMVNRYWLGFNVVRFVVQEGDRFYISEESFEDLIREKKLPKTFILSPTETRWAPYAPETPYAIEFDEKTAKFAERTFRDVQAVGWYLAKDRRNFKRISHTKWYSFETKATIHYPDTHVSSWIEMAAVPANDKVSAFHMSKTEIPYKLWKRIYRFADMPTYILSPRYHFRKDGDLGSARLAAVAHSQDEPVTNVTLHDAAVWCNALSELEGKTPCYYTDPARTQVFRFEELSRRYAWGTGQKRHLENPKYTNYLGEEIFPFGTSDIPMPKLYVKWSADGYRLPTPAEWTSAYRAGGTLADADHAWRSEGDTTPRTNPVGRKRPNALGISDLIGNAWELVWIWGDAFDPARDLNALALGGGVAYPDGPGTAIRAAQPCGIDAYFGSPNIALRLVRRRPGLPAPALGEAPQVPGVEMASVEGSPPTWLLRKGRRTGVAVNPRIDPEVRMLPVSAGSFKINEGDWHERDVRVSAFEMGEFAVTYAQWSAVRNWAEACGYEFDRSGDLGSCYWSDGTTHTTDEPVTRVTLWDAMVFCNALSEIQGRTPCYYTDVERKTLLRRAYIERPPHFPPPDFGTEPDIVPWVFVNYAADGYRLPTSTETRYAAGGENGLRGYPWGDDPGQIDIYAWHHWSRNSDGSVCGRTHGVAETLAAKKPTGFGLYDIVGNVYELSGSALTKDVRTRQPLDDVDNPKWDRFWAYGNAAYGQGARGRGRGLSFGCSWRYGVPWIKHENSPCCHQFGSGSRTESMPDTGFRIVRCEAGTHSVDGKMPLKPKVVLRYDPNDYDPLEGATHRHSIQRNAVFPDPGVPDKPRLADRFPTPGPVVASPVVHDGVAYFGCRPGKDGKGGALLALDAASMRELWRVDVPGGVDGAACIHKGSVYFGGRDGKLYAVSDGRDGGKVRWTVRVGNRPLGSAPAVAYDVVFILVGGYEKTSGVRGYQTRDGSLAYFAPGSPWENAATSLTPDLVLSSTRALNHVVANRLSDEKVAWNGVVPAAGRNDIVVVGETVIAVLGGGHVGGSVHKGHIASINLATGRQNWKRALEEHIPDEAYCFSSPVVWNGSIFLGIDNGRLHVYDFETGEPLEWRIRLRDDAGNHPAIRTSPSVSGPTGVVYFGAHDGVLRALDGKTGKFRWSLKLSDKPIESSVWVAGEALFVGTPEGLAKIVCQQP